MFYWLLVTNLKKVIFFFIFHLFFFGEKNDFCQSDVRFWSLVCSEKNLCLVLCYWLVAGCVFVIANLETKVLV